MEASICKFLPQDIQDMFRARVIDPGSILIDWHNDRLGSMDDLKKKHAPHLPLVSHDMLEDAWDTISLNRTTYPKRIVPSPLTPEEIAATANQEDI